MSAAASATTSYVGSGPRRRWTTAGSIVFSDLCALILAWSVAVGGRSLLVGVIQPENYFIFPPAVTLLGVIFAAVGLYPGIALHPVQEVKLVFNGTTLGYLILTGGTFLLQEGQSLSRLLVVFAWVMSIVLVLGCRTLTRRICAKQDWWGVPVVILGAGKTGQRIFSFLEQHRELGLKTVALLDDDSSRFPAAIGTTEPFYGPLARSPIFAQRFNVAYAIVAIPGLSGNELATIMRRYVRDFRHVLIIPNLFGMSTLWVSTRDFGGMLGLEVRQVLCYKLPQLVKRVFDVLVGGIVTIAVMPLLAIIYISILITCGGPVLYGHKRVGRGGTSFTAWKFRSMHLNADALLAEYLAANPEAQEEWDRDQKLRSDPRVTAIGRLLRKTSLDELPQLFNVIRGEMSLVGPRPIVQSEVQRYGEGYHLYAEVRPGVTGMWQVSGRNNTTYEERVKYDEYYVRNWSIWLDIYIIGRTVKTVLFAEGAY